MADNKQPRGRQQNITGTGKDIHKRGSGLGTGPVGNAGGYSGRPGTTQSKPSGSGQRQTRSGSIGIIAVVAALLLGGGGGLTALLGGGSDSSVSQNPSENTASVSSSAGTPSSASLSSLFSSYPSANLSGTSSSSGWTRQANTGKLNTSVASGSRSKYTQILGSNKDTVTIMVYMCGTDLESKSGMATSDLLEMTKATLSDNVNIIVYTGGCKQWKNRVVSSLVNQIYKVENGGLTCLVKNDGAKAMTSPDTLTAFIQWCAENYPANRNDLILWDHGGGSISGYGYDEKNARSGSMNLTGINKALYDAGMKFDFIGFDACLMATAENALMLTNYADYLIASEETEPGVGWYYTNWLTNLSANTSIDTPSLGKMIVDDFVDVCAQSCAGQKTTLSVIDLAELENTLPAELNDFSNSTLNLIQNDGYQTVSDARTGSREFSPSSKIDQVDLVHLATNLGTKEADELVNAILGAVKYNRTSSNMTNAYGLSIYFPYQKASNVSNAVKINDAIGMDSDYSRCIEAFASMEVSGQSVSSFGGAGSALPSLLGTLGSASSSSSAASGDMISSILGGLLGGGASSSGLDFFGRSIDMEAQTQFLEDNQFDANLVWVNDASGTPAITLTDKQWSLVQNLELNVFYDDGEGFIDLGLDTLYSFTDSGAISGDYNYAWPAVNGQNVAYYHIDTVEDGDDYTITGYIPVLLNGDRAELLLAFTDEKPNGEFIGVRWIYVDDETDTVAKGLSDEVILTDGSTSLTIDFVCDYYSYAGKYQNSYLLGDPITLKGTTNEDGDAVFHLNDLTFSDVYLPNPDAVSATYRFTDIYGQNYWTPEIP